jgi:hypothetical protein
MKIYNMTGYSCLDMDYSFLEVVKVDYFLDSKLYMPGSSDASDFEISLNFVI